MILLFACFALIGLGIETALSHLIQLPAVIPDLIVILAVDLGLRHHGTASALMAFAMGCAADAVAGAQPGLSAFMVTAVFLASYELSLRLMAINALTGAMVVFLAVLMTSLGSFAISAGIGGLSDAGQTIPAFAVKAGVSAIIAPAVFAMLARSKRALGLAAAPARE